MELGVALGRFPKIGESKSIGNRFFIDALRGNINQQFGVAFLSCLDGANKASIVHRPHFLKKNRTNCVG